MKIPHVIIDATVFPRDKVCGDAIDLKVIRVLNHLDPSIVDTEILNDANFVKARAAASLFQRIKSTTLILILAQQNS
jgi:hypothetical protein